MSKPPFKQLLSKSDVPVLVDFYADWCGPCKTMGPIIGDMSKKFSGRVKVVKINVDKNNGLANQLNIKSIPTLILFNKGKIVWRKAGLLSKKDLITYINNSIN